MERTAAPKNSLVTLAALLRMACEVWPDLISSPAKTLPEMAQGAITFIAKAWHSTQKPCQALQGSLTASQ